MTRSTVNADKDPTLMVSVAGDLIVVTAGDLILMTTIVVIAIVEDTTEGTAVDTDTRGEDVDTSAFNLRLVNRKK